MNESAVNLTVYFDEPFWVGVFERVKAGTLSVCKATFGAEPKDYVVLDFVLRQYYTLKFSSAVNTEVKQSADNPKRRQRNAKRSVRHRKKLSSSVGLISSSKSEKKNAGDIDKRRRNSQMGIERFKNRCCLYYRLLTG